MPAPAGERQVKLAVQDEFSAGLSSSTPWRPHLAADERNLTMKTPGKIAKTVTAGAIVLALAAPASQAFAGDKTRNAVIGGLPPPVDSIRGADRFEHAADSHAAQRTGPLAAVLAVRGHQ